FAVDDESRMDEPVAADRLSRNPSGFTVGQYRQANADPLAGSRRASAEDENDVCRPIRRRPREVGDRARVSIGCTTRDDGGYDRSETRSRASTRELSGLADYERRT